VTLETSGVTSVIDVNQQNDLRKALEFVLKWEGMYVNNISDPGGETKWGISKRAYPSLDIKNLTPEQALNIYVEDYWKAAGCGDYPFPLNVAIFDTAVNCGVGRAKRWTKEASKEGGSTMTVVSRLLEQRKLYYLDLSNSKNWAKKFVKGWLNRLEDLKKFVDSTDGA
jgi:lysozyme family protein